MNNVIQPTTTAAALAATTNTTTNNTTTNNAINLFRQQIGTNANDTLVGTNDNDSLYGVDGDDVVIGYGGNDLVSGNNGNDSVYGGAGDDYVYGGEGNDLVSGNEGNDSVYGGNGSDWVYGGAGNDYLDGGANNDSLYGGDGNDWVAGGAGSDWLDAGAGNNVVDGGEGYDLVNFNANFQDFNVVNTNYGFEFTHKTTGEVNQVTNVEQLQFTNGSIDDASLRNYLANMPVIQQPNTQDIPRIAADYNNGPRTTVNHNAVARYDNIAKDQFAQNYLAQYPYATKENVIDNQQQLNAFWSATGNQGPAPTVDFTQDLVSFNLIDANDPNNHQPVYQLDNTGALFSGTVSTRMGFEASNAYDVLVDVIPRQGISAIALDEAHRL